MTSFIEGILAFLAVLGFGILIYSLIKGESFIDTLNRIKELILEND